DRDQIRGPSIRRSAPWRSTSMELRDENRVPANPAGTQQLYRLKRSDGERRSAAHIHGRPAGTTKPVTPASPGYLPSLSRTLFAATNPPPGAESGRVGARPPRRV